jgi:hypothetical protein
MKRAVILVAALVVILLGAIYAIYFSKKQAPSVGSPLSSAPAAPIKIYFTTSVDKAPYGDFNFTYPVGFLLKEDDIKSDSAGKKYHVVVLERTAAPAGAIEINKAGKTCADYAKCETAKGVVIGTNSTDPGFLGIFNEVVGGF